MCLNKGSEQELLLPGGGGGKGFGSGVEVWEGTLWFEGESCPAIWDDLKYGGEGALRGQTESVEFSLRKNEGKRKNTE